MLYSLEDLEPVLVGALKLTDTVGPVSILFSNIDMMYIVSNDVWCLLRSIQEFFQLKKVDSNPEIMYSTVLKENL